MGYYEGGWENNGINLNSVNSKANAGLITGIIGDVLGLLAIGDKGGAINKLLGGGCCGNRAEAEALIAQIMAQAQISELKSKDYTDKTAQTLFNQIYADNKELNGYLCAERNRITELKGQIETDKAKGEVALLKMQLDNERAFNAYRAETDKRIANCEASIPLVQERALNAVELERERRECADKTIVDYVNGTFLPVQVADVTVGTTSTARTIYNPLPCQKCCR